MPFYWLVGHSYVIFWKNIYSGLLCILYYYYFLDYNSHIWIFGYIDILYQIHVCKFFSHSMDCLFILLVFSFLGKSVLVWCSTTIFFFFAFVICAFGVKSYHCHDQFQEFFFPMFSSMSFTLSGLTYKSLIHFDLISIYGIRVQFYSLECGYSVFLSSLIEENINFSFCILGILFKISWLCILGWEKCKDVGKI